MPNCASGSPYLILWTISAQTIQIQCINILRKQAVGARVYWPSPEGQKGHPAKMPDLEGALAVVVLCRSPKESSMLRQTIRLWIIGAIMAMVASGSLLGNAAAQKASVPKPQDKLALGEDEVKKLLLIMEPEKGKISKQEYMKFMEAEFERLDKDKNGELDVKKLTQSSVTANRYVGK